MKNALLRKSLLILLLLCTGWVMAQTATPPSIGDGSASNPYQIATLDNLYWITQNSSSWGSHFVQTANIDATSTSGWDGGAGFSPIGELNDPFKGSYNGMGHTISHLSINRGGQSRIGLFGIIASSAIIKNIGLTDVQISGHSVTGALVAYVGSNCSILNSYSTGEVSATIQVGGLIGFIDDATVNNSFSTCTVSGGYHAGGLVGYNKNGTVENSFARGSVSGTNDNIGGLVGNNLSNIIHSYSTGAVTGNANVGGLVGNSATGASVTGSFWDKQTSGQPTSAGGTGLVSVEMKVINHYINAGWDFMDETVNGTNDYWGINITVNDGYPFLSWKGYSNNPTPAGDGSQANPYQIATLIDLYWLSQTSSVWSSETYFVQTSDIDASNSSTWDNGSGFTRIGNNITNFSGIYNGKGYFINGIYINRVGDSYQALFGMTSITSRIMNIGVINVNITGYQGIGGLIGQNKGEVYNAYSSGSILADSFSGGLIGIDKGGTISNSYSTCALSDIDSNSSLGGFIGYCQENGSVSNSYATGLLTGNGNLGGLIGSNAGCTVTNSFWDTETTGASTSQGGIGKTTAEMKTESTFTDVGWDFDEIWDMDGSTNDGYPFLLMLDLPFVTTADVSNIGTNTAQSGGNISDEGSSAVIAKGVVWDITDNPTISSCLGITDDGSGSGSFTSSLSGLSPATVYYVRAYATNGEGTGYGRVKSFTANIETPPAMTPPGYALDFDGANGYVSLPHESNFDFTNAMTVEVWLKVDAFDKDWQAIVTKGDNAWRLHRAAATNHIVFGTTGLSNTDLEGNTEINDGQWHHIAGVFDGTTKYLYVDGVLDASVGANGSINNNYASVNIAENSQSTGRYFDGLIDEVRIWNIARTGTEIQENMNDALAGTDSGLVAYYKFDQSSGSVVYDHIGNSNLGTLHNMDDSDWVPSGWGTVSQTIVEVDDKTIDYGTSSLDLTATVIPTPNGGEVDFYVDDVFKGSVGVVTSTGMATLNINPDNLPIGNYVIRAEFSGHGIIPFGTSHPTHNGILEVLPPLLHAYVTPEGAGLQNGRNWQNAFDLTQLQFAMDISTVTEVWVAAGTYTPTSYNGIDPGEPEEVRHKHFFVPPGVSLFGGFTGNEPADYDLSQRDFDANETILSGDIGTVSNCYHVIVIGDAEATSTVTPTVTIDGFTVKDGQTYEEWHDFGEEDPVLTDFISFGAGLLLLNCNPEISNCKFINNEGYLGGGIGSFKSSPAISNCSFEDNLGYGSGAGLVVYMSVSELTGEMTTVTNCSFLNNISIQNFWDDENPFFAGGGAIYMFLSEGIISNSHFSGNEALYGGAVCNMFAIPEIENCMFEDNTGVIGGAIANLSIAMGKGTEQSQIVEYLRKRNPTRDDPEMITIVKNSIFKNNLARWKEGVSPVELSERVSGGGIVNINAYGDVINCLFYGNQAERGGAVANYSDELALTNCTMHGNSSLIGGAFYQENGIGAIHNTILWDNWVDKYPEPPYQNEFIGHQVAVVSGTFTLDYSCYPDGDDDVYIENGVTFYPDENIHLDPLFKNVSEKDYRITSASPCIDAGFDDYNTLLTDIRGEGYDRKLDITGIPGTIDIGAYEFNAPYDHDPKHYYVNDDAVGANNGANWTDAFNSLQSALATAIYDDVIWVAAGTYTPTHFIDDPDPQDTRMKTFYVAPGVRLYGGFAGNEPDNYDLETRNFQLNESILSGDIGTASNCYHVIISGQNPETASFPDPTLIDGFTITDGQADGEYSGIEFQEMIEVMGGGMLLFGGKQSVNNCIFMENTAGIGGGLAKLTGEISIDKCRFDKNTALLAGAGMSLIGAGAMEGEEAGLVSNCSFENNQVLFYEPSTIEEEMIPGGGAILSFISIVKFEHSDFNSNKALFGGAFCSMLSLHEIDHCNFTENLALMGGAIISFLDLSLLEIPENGKDNNRNALFQYLPDKEPQIITAVKEHLNFKSLNPGTRNSKDNDAEALTISNSVFSSNTADWELEPGMEELAEVMTGGAITVFGSDFDAVNCLFVENTAFTGGAIANIFGLANLTNVTLAENTAVVGGAYAQIDSESNFNNAIFWDNQVEALPGSKNGDVFKGHQIATISGTLTIDYSSYPDGPDDIFAEEDPVLNFGQNNIHLYPHFANVWEKDFRIAGSSPCVDKGYNEVNNEAFDIRGEGFPRIMFKTGSKYDPVIDMGAYEYNLNTDPPYPCNNPQFAGEIIATVTLVCSGDSPVINSIAEAGVYSGTLEYKWQQSTIGASGGFSDIENSNSAFCQIPGIATSTWFKRLARVDCMSDWSGAVVSNVVNITLYDNFTPGTITTTGETICYGENPTNEIGSVSPAFGGDENIAYTWRSSADDFINAIDGATAASYTPVGTLTATTAYRRYANDGACTATPAESVGTWTVTVQDEFSPGTIASGGEIICYNTNPQLEIGSIEDATGGNEDFTYSWRSSVDGFASEIPGAASPTFTPEGSLTGTTAYRRYVKEDTCNPAFLMSAGTWTVTVEEELTIDCPGNVEIANDSGNCSALVTFAAIAGGTPTPSLTYKLEQTNITSPHVFDVGIHTVVVTADNNCGERSCSFKVSVNDTEKPDVFSKNITIDLDETGNAVITAADIDNGSTDNCSIATMTLSRTQFSCTDLGETYTVTLTVTDLNGNENSCEATVTVNQLSVPLARVNIRATSAPDGKVKFTANPVNGGDNPTYKWYKLDANEVELLQEGTDNFIITTCKSGDEHWVEMTSGIPCTAPAESNRMCTY